MQQNQCSETTCESKTALLIKANPLLVLSLYFQYSFSVQRFSVQARIQDDPSNHRRSQPSLN